MSHEQWASWFLASTTRLYEAAYADMWADQLSAPEVEALCAPRRVDGVHGKHGVAARRPKFGSTRAVVALPLSGVRVTVHGGQTAGNGGGTGNPKDPPPNQPPMVPIKSLPPKKTIPPPPKK